MQVTRAVVFIPSRAQTPVPIWSWCTFAPRSAFKFHPSLGVNMRRVTGKRQTCAGLISTLCSAWPLLGYSKVFVENKPKVQLWGMITLSAPFKHIISVLSGTDYNNSWAATVILWMEGWERCDPPIQQSPCCSEQWAEGLGGLLHVGLNAAHCCHLNSLIFKSPHNCVIVVFLFPVMSQGLLPNGSVKIKLPESIPSSVLSLGPWSR